MLPGLAPFSSAVRVHVGPREALGRQVGQRALSGLTVPSHLLRWCGPCKILGPRLEKMVAKQHGKVVMAKVDIDDHTDLAIEYEVCFGRELPQGSRGGDHPITGIWRVWYSSSALRGKIWGLCTRLC